MNFSDIFIAILSIGIGYVVGSILPAYIAGRLKGIDIRKVGSKNAGTSNVYHELGIQYAIPTAIYDVLKGILAIFIAKFLGANFIITQIAGLAAIIGHIFPFYIKFRGGQGLATSMGLLIYYSTRYISSGGEILVFLLYILLIIGIFMLISKTINLISTLLFPLFGYFLWIFYPFSDYNIFYCIILAYITIMAGYNLIRENKIEIVNENLKSFWWRIALRPFTLILLIVYIFYSLVPSLILVGIIALIFIFIDILRISYQYKNKTLPKRFTILFKESEQKKLSEISIFLIGIFLTILIFNYIDKKIVITTMIYTILGEIFSTFLGLNYGKKKVFNKTIEAFLGYIISVLIFGFILWTLLEISLIILLIVGVAAAAIDILPLRINENLTVPILSGIIMTIFFLLNFY